MKKYIVPMLLVLSAQLFAQNTAPYYHHDSNAPQTASAGNSGTGSNIDVLYHRANWNVNPITGDRNINGTVTTYFKTLQPNVNTISFDLNQSSFNNASLLVQWHGINCSTSFPATGNVDVLNITLPTSITNANSIDSVSITYSGTPVQNNFDGGFSAGAYTDQAGEVQRYIITLSESYEDKDWWPCKADMQDKIDSMDINVTVPWQGSDTFWVASNGVLTDSSIRGALRTFKYKTRYPIASYLVCFAAAKYNRYYSSITVGGTNVPVYWYLLGGKDPSYYTTAVASMTKINQVVTAFSNKLGDYPFKLEKHGFYDGLLNADGMEHQTFSGIATQGLNSITTLSHELMHQWFGDNVTFATWNDLWLAEGFARYGEVLAAELVPALGQNVFNKKLNLKGSAIQESNASAWIPNSNIANSNTIWNSQYAATVYDRGGMIVSMLRAICGDTKFFQALTTYQTRMAGKTATADSVKQIFNEITGAIEFSDADLTEFFRDYAGGSGPADAAVGGIGNPVYQIKWNSPAANTLVLGVKSQSKSSGSNVTYFNGPVVVRATGSTAAQDTTIVFYDHGDGYLAYAGNGLGAPFSGNALGYQLSFTPTAIFYDDSARTLSTGTMVLDTTLKGYTWYGRVSTNWYDINNWASCCGIPPDNADVTIATVAFTPQVPSNTTVHHLTINSGKSINIGNNTFAITGTVAGSGTITGSASSNLVLGGKASVLNFRQGTSGENSLQSLVMLPGSSALLATNALIKNCSIGAAANLTIATGVNLITR